MARQLQQNFAAIGPAARTANQTTRFEPMAQFDGAVVLYLKPPGQPTDRRLRVAGKSFDSQ